MAKTPQDCVAGLDPKAAARLTEKYANNKKKIDELKAAEDKDALAAEQKKMEQEEYDAEVDEIDIDDLIDEIDLKETVDEVAGFADGETITYRAGSDQNNNADKYIKSLFSYNKRFNTVSVENIQRQVLGMFEKYSPALIKIIDTSIFKRIGESKRVTAEWFAKGGSKLKEEVKKVYTDKVARQIANVPNGDKVIARMVNNIDKLQAPNREKIRMTAKDKFVADMSDWVAEDNNVIGAIYDVMAGDKSLLDKTLRMETLGKEYEEFNFNFTFKDQASWQAFHNVYGKTNNVLDMLIGVLDSNSKEIGLIKTFNSVNPREAYDNLISRMTADGFSPSGGLGHLAAEAFDETLGWDPKIGAGRMKLYQALSAVPKLSNLAILHKAFITAFGTDMMAWSTMKAVKFGDWQLHKDAINYAKSVGSNIMESLGKDTRFKKAMRHVAIQRQGMLQRFMHNVRLGEDNFDAGGATRKIENAVWWSNVMTKISQIGHDYAIMDSMGKLAQFRGKQWDELPNWLKGRLAKSEIYDDEWNEIISNDEHFIKIDGEDVINYDGFEDYNLDLYNRLDNFIRNDADQALGSESMTVTSVKNRGKKKGGERVSLQYIMNLKSYLVRQSYQTLGAVVEKNDYVGWKQRGGLGVAVVVAGYGAGLQTDFLKSIASGDVKIGDSKSYDDWWNDEYTHIAATTYGIGLGVMNDAISSLGSSLLRDKQLGNEITESTGNIVGSPAIQAMAEMIDALWESGETGIEFARKGRVSNKQWKSFAKEWGDVRDSLMTKLAVVEMSMLHGVYDSRDSLRDVKKDLERRQHRDFGAWMERGLFSK